MTTVRLRASSLSEFADCAARWKARHLDGLKLPTSGAAHLGTSLHRSTAVFDAARIAGKPVSADEAADALVKTLHHPGEDVAWGEDSPRASEKIGLILHTRYCRDVAPRRTYTGVEVPCESLTVDCDGVRLDLTGTIDRVRRLPDGRIGIGDLKSGKRAVDSDGRVATKGHGLQVALYELLTERALGQPITAPAEIVGLCTVPGAPRVATGKVATHREVLIGTHERPGLLDAVAQALKSGIFVGNSRSMLCSPKFCPAYPTCPWRD